MSPIYVASLQRSMIRRIPLHEKRNVLVSSQPVDSLDKGFLLASSQFSQEKDNKIYILPILNERWETYHKQE